METPVYCNVSAVGSRWPAILAMALACCLAPRGAHAQGAIGTAVVVQGQVSGSFGGRTSSLARGDGVVSNEVVRTQVESSGEISFIDQTKLFVGPVSTVTLDKFAFDQSGAASRLTVDVSRGALRFISGRSGHGAYGVKTPFGSLGLRGTIVDVVVQRGRVIVTDQMGVNQGPVVVTARNGKSVTLAPGQSAILTSSGVTGPLGQQGQPDFASACGGCTSLFGFGNPLGIQPRDPAGPGGGSGGKGDSGSGGQQGGSSSGGSSSSDIRLKRDIVEVARLDNGIGLYRFRYNWSDEVYVGVMAQEVAKVEPDAVERGADGYLKVFYGKLGLRLETWDEWVQEHPKAERSSN
jgi:FecR protein/Chaperone of endosialidase